MQKYEPGYDLTSCIHVHPVYFAARWLSLLVAVPCTIRLKCVLDQHQVDM